LIGAGQEPGLRERNCGQGFGKGLSQGGAVTPVAGSVGLG
jgi:hypothetical protein